jgi:c-di-AMP phosphodiesterase-like protein
MIKAHILKTLPQMAKEKKLANVRNTNSECVKYVQKSSLKKMLENKFRITGQNRFQIEV